MMFPTFETLSPKRLENAYYDVMHVSTHYIFGRDIFLTKDKDFDAEKLREKFEGLGILTPQECADTLQEVFSVTKERKNETGTIY